MSLTDVQRGVEAAKGHKLVLQLLLTPFNVEFFLGRAPKITQSQP
jgi:hypothetical protein